VRPIERRLRRALYRLRLHLGKLIVCPEPRARRFEFTETIVYKAAQFASAEHVPGDYLEFGSFEGKSLVQAFGAIEEVYGDRYADVETHSREYREKVRELWQRMRFFAFDSFQGLPPVSGIDAESSDFAEGMFGCSLEDFLANVRAAGVDVDKVTAVPGWFDETCSPKTVERYGMRHAAIVHVDCDLYRSAAVALDFIEPLLVDGTVLIFDDWYAFRGNPGLGEQRAFREWSSRLRGWTFTEFQKEGPWRNSFIANRVLDAVNPQERS
jgi:O-methyltransferase